MANILFVLSQYELLEQLAQYLSTLDLFHLALTCSEHYNLICQSEPIFDRLKRVALCDGHGLKMRQEFKGIYALSSHHFVWGKGRKAHYDEELEVRVWNLKCDATNALPCLRCKLNVCEECRYMPRVRDTPAWLSCRRPHLDPAYQSHTIICYCTACDENVERDLPQRLSEYCDCDQYTRWICLPCKIKEDQPETHYYETRTKLEWLWDDADPSEHQEGMWLHDHQQERAFWCPCGKRAPSGGNVRCAWCKRRHNLDTWMNEDPNIIPFFDHDPCFPKIVWDPQTGDHIMYPDLGYRGPVAP